MLGSFLPAAVCLQPGLSCFHVVLNCAPERDAASKLLLIRQMSNYINRHRNRTVNRTLSFADIPNKVSHDFISYYHLDTYSYTSVKLPC